MHVLFYKMKLIVSKEIHIVKVIFSDDLEIKKNQEIAEYLNIDSRTVRKYLAELPN